MTFLVDFFKSISDVVTSVIGFVTDLFSGILDFTLMIPEYVDMLTDLISQLPGELVGFASLTLAATLIFVIIGRRGT